MTDTIADFLTRIRNAVAANHRIVEVPTSNVKKEITKILFTIFLYLLLFKMFSPFTNAVIYRIFQYRLFYGSFDMIHF